jgi:hypothetical protein
MRRHQLDPVSLVFGFAFTAAGLLFLAGQVEQAVRLRWLWPLLLLALGLGILLDLGTRRPRAPDAVEAVEGGEGGEPEPPVAAEPPAGPEPLAPERVEAERPAPAEPPAGPEPLAPEEATRTAELDREDAPPERDR